jgi:hypothetical protein
MTASKDATVYLQQPNQNTGLDEILEISKVYYGSIKDVSHALIKFDVGYISASISNNSITMSSAELILRETKSEEIPLEYTIYANPISGSWEMGTGTRFDNISTQGVTWNYREGDSKLEWLQNNFESNTTASVNNGDGGTWYTNYETSQTFNYQTSDINMNVKSILRAWMSGSIVNDGMILKYSTEKESDTADYGQLKFFSKETHTIYQPKIRIGWDDSVFSTGSLVALTANDIKIGVTNLKKEYKVGTNEIKSNINTVICYYKSIFEIPKKVLKDPTILIVNPIKIFVGFIEIIMFTLYLFKFDLLIKPIILFKIQSIFIFLVLSH